MNTFTLPHDIEVEQSVLGALLTSIDMQIEYIPEVNENDFFQLEHKKILAAIKTLNTKNETIDILTVVKELKKTIQIQDIGGSIYLAEISLTQSKKYNIKKHIDILKDSSHRRIIIETSRELMYKAADLNNKIDDIVNQMSNSSYEMSMNDSTDEPLHVAVVAADAAQEILEQKNSGSKLSGLNCGYKTVNDFIGGLNKGDLIVLAARPSMGKSALAVNMADYMSISHNMKSLFFSHEMRNEDLIKRVLAARTSTNLRDIRRGTFKNERSYEIVIDEVGRMANKDLYLYGKPATVEKIRTISMKQKRKIGLDCIFIDYLQHLKLSLKTDNMNQQIGHMTKTLKDLAKELNIPIVLLSQLSRNVEHRADKRPLMSDLRDSGSIEQDADVVMMMYRDSYYYPDEYTASPEHKWLTELTISKNRNGRTGKIQLDFANDITKFCDRGEMK